MWYRRATTLILILVLLQWHIVAAATASRRPSRSGRDEGDSDDSQLHCEKTAWYDVCWFFFTNYLLHALSVRSLPGENAYSSTVFKLCCLLVPYTGVRRGLSLISRASSLNRNDLQAAARAGALCMVIRKPDWRPENGQTVAGCQIVRIDDGEAQDVHYTAPDEKGESIRMSVVEKSPPRLCSDDKPSKRVDISLDVKDDFEPQQPSGILQKLTCLLVRTDRFNNECPSKSPVDHNSIKIHGSFKLAPGYGLSYVPPNVKIHPRHEYQVVEGNRISTMSTSQVVGRTRIASTHDIPRIWFSLIQTVSGGYSLYKARGSQINHYGFAAFGLTVLPYMIVSVVNFLGSFLSAEYETMYMVHSATMDEMILRGGMVDGVVGTLHGNTEDARQLSWSSTEDLAGPACTSITFTKTEDNIFGHDTSGVTRHDFAVLPYEPLMPPSKHLFGRWLNRLRQWHGMAVPAEIRSKPQPHGPAIRIPTHSPIHHLPEPSYQSSLNVFSLLILFLTLALPYAVIAILTGWKANQSTSVQQNFVLAWLICGQTQGYAVSKVERLTGKKTSLRGMLFIFIFYSSNCLCGLTIVAQEMLEFGTCKAV